MATFLTHPLIPLAMAAGLGRVQVTKRLLAAGMVASILPDADVLAFYFRIPYDHPFGHRGFSHSIFFAFLVGLAGFAAARAFGTTRAVASFFLFVSTVSHGLLDALTNGGLGIAFFAPFDNTRYFLPWQVIEASPLTSSRFLSARGWAVIQSELRWVWLPVIALSMLLLALRLGMIRLRKLTPSPPGRG
ncbi:MAG: metal-dependent hydrolase [Pseudomonadota bacterium]